MSAAMSLRSSTDLITDTGNKEPFIDIEPEVQVRYRTGSGASGSQNMQNQAVDLEGYGSPDAFVNVETEGDPIAKALQQCEYWVLTPYRFMLKALGWTPFTKDGDSKLLKILRVCLVVFWLFVIILTFITQILSCFRRDSFQPNRMTNSMDVMCTEHIISSYILPDLLLLASYLFGLYLFSKDETEYLSNLAEKAFVKGAQAKLHFNKKLIITLSVFLIVGVVWIVTSFIVRLMTSFALDLWNVNTTITWDNSTVISGAGKETLLVISLIGFISFDIIYIAAVINYAAQSEMNIYLLAAIRKMILDKYHSDIDGGIKDILECRKYLRVLNGKTATATALIMFNLGSAGVLAIVALNAISEENARQDLKDLGTVAVGFNVVLWMGLVFFPFIQAARVSHYAQELKATGPEIRARPLQYSKSPQIELDSFVSLTRAVRLRATIFGIPVYPWLVWFTVVAFFFSALILFQTGVYNFTDYL